MPPNVLTTTLGDTSNLLVEGGGSLPAVPQPLAALGAAPVFVFRPNAPGVQPANVYPTWAALYAVASLLGDQPVTVFVDDIFGAAHVTAGTYNIDQWTFIGNFNSPTETLIFDNGAVFNPGSFRVDGGLTLKQNGNTAVMTQSVAGSFVLIELVLGVIVSATAAPFFAIGAGIGQFTITFANGSGIGDTAHPVVNSSSTQVFLQAGPNVGQGFSITSNALAGTGTITVNFGYASGGIGPIQPVTTLTLSQPINLQSAVANTGTGTATVSAVTGNITRQRAGRVNVRGYASGSTSGAATVTVQLKRDASNIGTTMQAILTAAGPFNIPIEFDDVLPDGSAHTYTLAATASAGTIATAASGVFVRAQEQ